MTTQYFDLPERRDSFKLTDSDGTVLGNAVRAWLSVNAGPCGVFRLQLGIDALTDIGDKGETIKHFQY